MRKKNPSLLPSPHWPGVVAHDMGPIHGSNGIALYLNSM